MGSACGWLSGPVPEPEWLVEFTLPPLVGNLYFMREHLKGRLITPQPGGATVLAGYVQAPSALEAAEVFGTECQQALGAGLMRRVSEFTARKVRY